MEKSKCQIEFERLFNRPDLPEHFKDLFKGVFTLGWNAGINAADNEAWTLRDSWEREKNFSNENVQAANEIGVKIRELIDEAV